MANAARLKELLGPYRGHGAGNSNGNKRPGNKGLCPVLVVYRNRSARCELELGEEWRVSLQDNLLQSLAAHFEAENIKVIY
jgi:DNA polymerase-3 subunit alpha